MCLSVNISEFTNISEGLTATLNLTQVIVQNIYCHSIFHAYDELSNFLLGKT